MPTITRNKSFQERLAAFIREWLDFLGSDPSRGRRGIDRESAWRKQRHGEWGRRFYELHDKPQLLAIASQAKYQLVETLTREQIIAALLAPHLHLPLPRELRAKAKGQKQKTAEAAKGKR